MSDIRRSLMSLASSGSSGGKTLVASGEFVGASSGGRQEISIGNKMAATDFYLLIKAKDGSEFERNGYSFVWLALCVLSDLGRYNLSNNGTCAFAAAHRVYDKNNDVLTALTAGAYIKDMQTVNEGGLRGSSDFNTFSLARSASDGTFHIYFGHSNSLYNLPSNVTYEYEVVYFGDDPANDIVII